MTDDTVAAKLAEWETLTEAATPGPWVFEPGGEFECGEPQCCYEYWDNRIWGDGAVLTESHMLSEADGKFIAAARTAMPALLGFVREVQKLHHLIKDSSLTGLDVDPFWRCSCGALDCPTEQALAKWIGGEG